MKTKLGLALIVITVAIVPQFRAAAQGMPRMHGGEMFGGPMMAAYLGLTQDQISQLKTLRSSQAAKTKPLMQAMGTYQRELRQMTQSTTQLDAGQLQTLAAQMAQVQAQLTVARAQMEWQFFNKILTPDQQAKLTSMQQQMQQMREDWKSNHPANPGSN